jgi:hypothetical protein
MTGCTGQQRYEQARDAHNREYEHTDMRQLACVAHVIALMVALHNGLGSVPSHLASGLEKAYSLQSYERGSRATFASAVFLLISLALAKCSVVVFMQRLLARDSKKLYAACYVLVAVFAAWGLGSIIGISIGCDTNRYILDDATEVCGNQVEHLQHLLAYPALMSSSRESGGPSQPSTCSQRSCS